MGSVLAAAAEALLDEAETNLQGATHITGIARANAMATLGAGYALLALVEQVEKYRLNLS